MTGPRSAPYILCAVLIAAGAAGCGGVDMLSRERKAERLIEPSGWTRRVIPAGMFDLVSYAPPGRSLDAALVVYIEGDGFAFRGPHTVSLDPTPDDPIALRLAMQHPGAHAAYLARPCQYTMPDNATACAPAYWTTRRYAPEVISSIDRAVDVLRRDAGATRIILVGYSGGGAVAVLVASLRRDVAGIVTIVANLDLKYWIARDNLAPLAGSLDPADAAARVARIPQVHFAGGRDDVVGPDVVRSYLARMGDTGSARLIEIGDYGHVCCWADAWPDLAGRSELQIIPGWK